MNNIFKAITVVLILSHFETWAVEAQPNERIAQFESFLNESEQQFGSDFGNAPEELVSAMRSEISLIYASSNREDKQVAQQLYERLNAYSDYSNE